MHPENPSIPAGDQCEIALGDFDSQLVSGTQIRLLRSKPEHGLKWATQLLIPRLCALLVKRASLSSISRQFLQHTFAIGSSNRSEKLYLVVSVLVEETSWRGDWQLAIVPQKEIRKFQAFLTSRRETFVARASA